MLVDAASATRRSWSRSASTATSCRCSRSATARRALPLRPARDYKRIGDGDPGPNTGGMGAYSPVPEVDDASSSGSAPRSTSRSSTSCARRGTPFHGVLFAGLMLTADGPKVLEFNVRFGDPETQAVLPRLRSDLLDLLAARHPARRLAGAALEWDARRRSRVVLASRGYPASLVVGRRDRGLDRVPDGVEVTHAGTARARRRRRHGRRPRAQRDRARRRHAMPPGSRVCCRRRDRVRRPAAAPGHRRMSRARARQPVTEVKVEAEFEGLEVDAPLVGIVMGSKSDMDAMEAAAKELRERGIRHEVRVMSAHREPDTVADYAKNAKLRGLRVIIAGAGLSAALPGVVAAHTDAAGDRRPADVVEVGRRRARRAALDRADAARRAGGLRGRRQRAQRRRAGGAHPRRVIARYTRPELGARSAGPTRPR